MFEKATRQKIRYATARGELSVEDLWDLPMTGRGVSLDSIARSLHRDIQDSEVSFVTPSNLNTVAMLKLDLVKHIIGVRMEEIAHKEKMAADAAHRERVQQVIRQKKESALMDMSIEELEKLLA